MASYTGQLSCTGYKLSIVSIVHSLYCALINLAFSWLYKEKIKGLLQLEKVMVYLKTHQLATLKFVNTKCDNFSANVSLTKNQLLAGTRDLEC